MEPYGEVDIIWRSLNKWGKFQLFQWVVVLLDLTPACFAILSAVFTGNIQCTVHVSLAGRSYLSGQRFFCSPAC